MLLRNSKDARITVRNTSMFCKRMHRDILERRRSSTDTIKLCKADVQSPATAKNAATIKDDFEYDLKMDSLTSMELETEISLSQGLRTDEDAMAVSQKSDSISLESSKLTDSVGSLFNTMLSHSNTGESGEYNLQLM